MLVSTDTELVQRAADADREAFEQLFAACLPAVWAFATRRSVGRAGAEALTTRILRRAFLELEHYDGEVPFGAWLLGVARRVTALQAPRPSRLRGSGRHTHA